MIGTLIIAAANGLRAVIATADRRGRGYTPRSGPLRPDRMPSGGGGMSLPVAWPEPSAPTPPGSQLIDPYGRRPDETSQGVPIKFGAQCWVDRPEWTDPTAQEALRLRLLDGLLEEAARRRVVPVGRPHLEVEYFMLPPSDLEPEGSCVPESTGWFTARVRVWFAARRPAARAAGE